MFVCDKCLAKRDMADSFEALFGSRSRGPCEDCGKIAVCADVHHSALKPIRAKAKGGDDG